LSQVDPAEAQSQFEDAAKGLLMTDNADIFQIKESSPNGYDDLTPVYSRCWYLLPIAPSLNNVMVNLGGIKSADQLSTIITDPAQLAAADAKVKPANYVGQYFPFQFGTMTNNPVTGYFLDGLPNTIDPRAYQMFYIPGNTTSATYPNGTCGAINTTTTGAQLRDANNKVVKTIDATWTWNAIPDGQWSTGQVNSKNDVLNIGNTNGFVPSLQQDFRAQNAKRVFFAPWETYFLLAEADVRGWATPVDGQTAYQNGIQSSFSYWGVSVGNYLTSDDYNTDGTSVDWNNTTEPGPNHMMSDVDGMTGTPGTVSINYPVNNLYMSGAVRNDHLTKIITQKFIAQTPWLPLETWSDHRRLGLPFWENVILEAPIQTLPALTSSNYMTSNQQFFPQRMKYPSGLQNSNVSGYNQAISALGGSDNVLTPLWWAQH
ncbi:MAG: SusD/RagB family nutrient-binding outer membrane lipoprotein, partial [Ginsengibacter sp.]